MSKESDFFNKQAAANAIGCIDQMASSNCISPTCPSSYYPQLGSYQANVRSLSVEAVEQGYVVEAHWGGKKVKRVALTSEGLASILRDWGAQFECKAK